VWQSCDITTPNLRRPKEWTNENLPIPQPISPFPQQILTPEEKIFTNCYQNQKTPVYLSAYKAIKQ
jgi:hypothetical protein